MSSRTRDVHCDSITIQSPATASRVILLRLALRMVTSRQLARRLEWFVRTVGTPGLSSSGCRIRARPMSRPLRCSGHLGQLFVDRFTPQLEVVGIDVGSGCGHRPRPRESASATASMSLRIAAGAAPGDLLRSVGFLGCAVAVSPAAQCARETPSGLPRIPAGHTMGPGRRRTRQTGAVRSRTRQRSQPS